MITCSAPWELVQALHPKGFDDISKEVTSESGSSSAVKANFAGDSSGGALFRDPATGFCRCVAVCCSVLQCVAVCCSVLQCVAVCGGCVAIGTVYCCESCRTYTCL